MSKSLAFQYPFAAKLGFSTAAPKIKSRTYFTPTHTRSLPLSQKKSVLSAKSSLFSRYGFIALAGLNIIMVVAYIVSINASAASGYEISSIQGRVATLEEQNKKLTIQNSEVDSMSAVQTDLSRLGFVPVTHAENIYTQPNQLTQR